MGRKPPRATTSAASAKSTGKNLTRAAKALGVSRNTVRKYL